MAKTGLGDHFFCCNNQGYVYLAYKCGLRFLFWVPEVPLLMSEERAPKLKIPKTPRQKKGGKAKNVTSALRKWPPSGHPTRLKTESSHYFCCCMWFFWKSSFILKRGRPTLIMHQMLPHTGTQSNGVKNTMDYNGETAPLQITQDMSASYQALMCI